MDNKIIFRQTAARGCRVNAAPESDIPEEVLVGQAAMKKQASKRKKSRRLSIVATVFLWLPLIYPFVFFIHGALRGYPLPIVMYPYLVLYASLLSSIGGLLLYLAARAANTLRKPIGWTALALFVLPIISIAVFGNALYLFDYSAISAPRVMFVFVCLVLTLLCMIALGALSILLLIRVFQRKKEPAET
jgi:hypothetical protein